MSMISGHHLLAASPTAARNMSGTTLAINCLVLGDPKGKGFIIKILATESVSALKVYLLYTNHFLTCIDY
jgi:hypothetical protein